MSKHIDFTAYEVRLSNEAVEGLQDMTGEPYLIFPVIAATGSESCEYCGEAGAEFVIDASELGQGGYSPGYCYEHALSASQVAWTAGEEWLLKSS